MAAISCASSAQMQCETTGMNDTLYGIFAAKL
jgi:hypothetical protein